MTYYSESPRQTSRHCTLTTAAGKPCRAWAVKGTEPAACSAHAGRNIGAGAPPKNKNAQKLGFYSPVYTAEEIVDMINMTADSTLDDEIVSARIHLRRVFEWMSFQHSSGQPLSAEDYIKASTLIFTGTNTIARLLRSQRALSGEAADGIVGAMAQALDELSNEWGVNL